MKKSKHPQTRPTVKYGRDKILSCSWGPSSCSLYRPTWVEINHKSFTNNIKQIKSLLNNKTKITAVVKANAYGHMAEALSKIAVRNGVDTLGVSSIEEGISLRSQGIKSRILILGSMYPLENLEVSAQYGLTPTISSLKGFEELSRIGSKLGRRLPFHLKVDTGMGRIGISADSADAILERSLAEKSVALSGIYTHFSCADSDPDYTKYQLKRFQAVLKAAKKNKLRFIAHSANSAAMIRFPETHFDMVRPGLSLYGLSPFAGADKKINLEPVLQWKTRAVFLKRVPKNTAISYGASFVTKRPSLIATLPVGYADGYSRSLSNKGKVLLRGELCPVVGRVTMDMIIVDVTGIKGVSIGDEVVLIGGQGGARISAEDMASWAGTINYEITCAISGRVPRVLV